MCGLFGYTFKRSPGASLVALLAHHMDSRGGQAWGYLNARNGATTKGLKRISKQTRRIGLLSHVMAHTRFATQGANIVANAHPFEARGEKGRIHLAHNGQVYNGDPKYTVDSMEIAERVANGVALDDLRGYGVVTWYDRAQPFRIYLARLTESGSISVALTSKGVLYASTKDAVEEACEMARLKVTQFYAVETGVVHYLSAQGLFSTKAPALKLSSQGTADSWRNGLTKSAGASGGNSWSWSDTKDEEYASTYRLNPTTGKYERESVRTVDGALVGGVLKGSPGVQALLTASEAAQAALDLGLTEKAMTEEGTVKGPVMMLREELESDLSTLGYEKDAFAGLEYSELLDVWEREFWGAGISDSSVGPSHLNGWSLSND